jgi:hypothetical protein
MKKKIIKWIGIVILIIVALILIHDIIVIKFKPNIGCCSCCGDEPGVCIAKCCSCAKPIILK